MIKADCKNEIISFVKNSSDLDNLIVATFIVGMQTKKTASIPTSCVSKQNISPIQTVLHNPFSNKHL